MHRGSWTWNGPYAEHRMKIWLDDIRPAPAGYVLVRSVNEAKRLISSMDKDAIEVVDCDHDLGDREFSANPAAYSEPGRTGQHGTSDKTILGIKNI